MGCIHLKNLQNTCSLKAFPDEVGWIRKMSFGEEAYSVLPSFFPEDALAPMFTFKIKLHSRDVRAGMPQLSDLDSPTPPPPYEGD